MSICLLFCQSSVDPSVNPSVHLGPTDPCGQRVHPLSFNSSISPSVNRSVDPYVNASFNLSVNLLVNPLPVNLLPVHPSVKLSVDPSVNPPPPPRQPAASRQPAACLVRSGSTNPRELDPKLISPIFDIFCCCLPRRARNYLHFNVQRPEVGPPAVRWLDG